MEFESESQWNGEVWRDDGDVVISMKLEVAVCLGQWMASDYLGINGQIKWLVEPITWINIVEDT